jgi:tetratricopeptide (TPR) repeat protein
MPKNSDDRIIFISLPQFFSHNHKKEDGFIDPDIPVPVELPPRSDNFNTEELSEEMVLAGMMRVISADPFHKHAMYYRRFVLAARPDIFDELSYAAMVKAENNDFNAAFEILDALEGLFPDFPKLLSLKSEILKKREEFFHENDGEFSFEDALFQEAYHAVDKGDLDAGLAKIRAFLEKNPDVWNAWFLLGWALRKSGDYGHAADSFRHALEKGGANADTRNELALCLMEKGDLKAARKELETALQKEPENIKIISNLGALALKTGDKTEAAGFFRTVLEIDPDDQIAKDYLNSILL